MNTRRSFTTQFKDNAVRWSEVVPAIEVARACEIDVTLLHRWRRQSLARGKSIAMRPERSKDFKMAAVRRLEAGERAREVARALDVKLGAVRRWLYEFRKYGTNAFLGYGRSRRR